MPMASPSPPVVARVSSTFRVASAVSSDAPVQLAACPSFVAVVITVSPSRSPRSSSCIGVGALVQPDQTERVQPVEYQRGLSPSRIRTVRSSVFGIGETGHGKPGRTCARRVARRSRGRPQADGRELRPVPDEGKGRSRLGRDEVVGRGRCPGRASRLHQPRSAPRARAAHQR
jgi:hypothetical protein